MIVWLIADWLPIGTRLGKFPLAGSPIPAVACLLALAILTHRQVGYWHDPESFWKRALALTQDNYIAHEALAGFLHTQGRTDEALVHVRATIPFAPTVGAPSWLLRTMNLRTAIWQGYRALSNGWRIRAGEQVGFRTTAYNQLGLSITNSGNWRRRSSVSNNRSALRPTSPCRW